jgi:hypothetical protein
MTLQLLLASAAVKLLPMTEPVAASDAAELARVEFDIAPSMVEHFVPAQYPPGKGQPGYGWPSRIEDYTVDDALAERLAAYPGLEAHWFVREPIEGHAADFGRTMKLYADSIPFLLFRPQSSGVCWWNPFSWFDFGEKVPLVVYLPGNGELGTDLAKQFRQTGVIGRVVGDGFQEEHRAWLLVPMPPERGNVNMPKGYPVQPRAPLITLLDDLVLKVIEMSHAEGESAPPIDEHRIYLTGLGCGGSMAVAMSLDHPGRYAVTAPVWSSAPLQRVVHPDAPGNWWFGYEENIYSEAVADSKEYYEKFWGKFREDVERFGGSFALKMYSKGERVWWWDAMWESAEFWDWCFSKRSDFEVEVKK